MMTEPVIYLNLTGSTPFITEVECLIGGIPRLLFPDETQQFVDADEEPVHIFSPRLSEKALEKFCEEHIEKYRDFHEENAEKLLRYDRVAMDKFWD